MWHYINVYAPEIITQLEMSTHTLACTLLNGIWTLNFKILCFVFWHIERIIT